MTFALYSNTGPFNLNAVPALTAVFFNNLESFNDQIVSSAVADANITSNGAGTLTVVGLVVSGAVTFNGAGTGLTVANNATITGNLTVTKANFTTGSISRIATAGPYSITTTPTFFNHNLGAIPDFVIAQISGTGTGQHTIQVDFTSLTTTQVKLTCDSSCFGTLLSIKF